MHRLSTRYGQKRDLLHTPKISTNLNNTQFFILVSAGVRYLVLNACFLQIRTAKKFLPALVSIMCVFLFREKEGYLSFFREKYKLAQASSSCRRKITNTLGLTAIYGKELSLFPLTQAAKSAALMPCSASRAVLYQGSPEQSFSCQRSCRSRRSCSAACT